MTINPLGLSNDAYAALSAFWLTILCTDLVFNTPSRIHPRMGLALIELEDAGLITKEVEALAGPDTFRWTFRAVVDKTIGKITPMSQRRQRELSVPITRD